VPRVKKANVYWPCPMALSSFAVTRTEKSSRVAMEALAPETPVVAFANARLPEIIDHGKNRTPVSDEEGMAAAISKKGRNLSPIASAGPQARDRFDVRHILNRYFERL